ncbi:MAG: hypothetical protein IIB69_05000 [Proteobacteria bacterium]|nr:hypothetical protein [Pseudomonadota bacterium]
MSDELFEVAFSGQIVDGTNPEEVKTRIRKMFKADDAKIATLFSGNRVIIKKNIDQLTATKYKAALFQAGAVCEIISMSAGGAAASPAPAQQAGEVPASPSAQKSEPAPAPTETPDVSIETGDWGEVEPPPQVDPLGITGDQIEDLDATVAPVGSAVLDKIEEMPEPQFDLSEFDIAPVGSDLGSAKKEPDPPPPDTTGITMAD